jgi:hypothetical protein
MLVMSRTTKWGLNCLVGKCKASQIYSTVIIQAFVIECNETIYKLLATANDNLKNVQLY